MPPSHKIRLVKGPANETIDDAIGGKAVWLTYPPTKNKIGKLRCISNITNKYMPYGIPKRDGACNVALAPNAIATNLWANSCNTTAGAAISAPYFISSIIEFFL